MPMPTVNMASSDRIPRTTDLMTSRGPSRTPLTIALHSHSIVMGGLNAMPYTIRSTHKFFSVNPWWVLLASHSHSIVPGGFEVMSYTTRFTPRTSFTIRFEIVFSTSYGSGTQSAVMPSSECTARTAQV